jgi:hypothetical protein
MGGLKSKNSKKQNTKWKQITFALVLLSPFCVHLQ